MYQFTPRDSSFHALLFAPRQLKRALLHSVCQQFTYVQSDSGEYLSFIINGINGIIGVIGINH